MRPRHSTYYFLNEQFNTSQQCESCQFVQQDCKLASDIKVVTLSIIDWACGITLANTANQHNYY